MLILYSLATVTMSSTAASLCNLIALCDYRGWDIQLTTTEGGYYYAVHTAYG